MAGSRANWGTAAGGLGGAAVGGAIGGPMGAGVGLAAGSLLGGAVGDMFEDNPDPAYVDPSLYKTPEYDAYLAGLDERRAAYTERMGPTLDWSQANADRQLALQARGYQDQAAQSYLDVLNGKGPSLAQQQLQQGLTTANALAMQQAASARGGPGNVLLANQQAQRTAAANSLATNAAMGQLKAREIDAARAGLLGAGSQMRGQDLDQRAGSQNQQKIGADVELQQTGLNDAMVRSLEQARLTAMGGQQDARSQYAQAVLAAQGVNAQTQQANKDYTRQLAGGIAQTGGQLAGMGFQAGENEKNRQAAYGNKPAPAPPPAGGGWGSGYGSDVVDPWGKKLWPTPSALASPGPATHRRRSSPPGRWAP